MDGAPAKDWKRSVGRRSHRLVPLSGRSWNSELANSGGDRAPSSRPLMAIGTPGPPRPPGDDLLGFVPSSSDLLSPSVTFTSILN